MPDQPFLEKSRVRRGIAIAVGLPAASLVVIAFLTIRRDTFSAISHVSPFFFILAVAISLGKWFWSIVTARILISSTGKRVSLRDLAKIMYAQSFTGIVTPLQAGGVAVEGFFLYEYRLDAGEAAGVVGFSAAVSTLILVLTFPAALFFGIKYLHLSFTFRGALLVGLLLAIVFLALVLLALFQPSMEIDTRLLAHSPLFLRKRGGYQRFIHRLASEVRTLGKSLRDIMRLGPLRILLVIFFSLMFWVFGFFAVPVLLIGLGFPELFWKAVLAQMVIQVLLPFIPVPGGSGFGDAGFFYVYSSIVPESGLAGFLTLLWRFVDYYLNLLVGGIFFVLIMRDLGKSSRRERIEKAEIAEGLREKTSAEMDGKEG